jgi:hypothetical protein
MSIFQFMAGFRIFEFNAAIPGRSGCEPDAANPCGNLIVKLVVALRGFGRGNLVVVAVDAYGC